MKDMRRRSNRKGYPWSIEEIDFIREHWKVMSDRKLSKALCRSTGSVAKKRAEIDIRRPQPKTFGRNYGDYMTPEQYLSGLCCPIIRYMKLQHRGYEIREMICAVTETQGGNEDRQLADLIGRAKEVRIAMEKEVLKLKGA